MKTENAREVLTNLLSATTRAGADAADAVISRSVSTSVSWRMGALEDINRSEGADLGLRVMIGKRQASVSTTDFSKASLDALAQRCVDMAKAAPEDPYCGLAPKDRLALNGYPEIDLGDYQEPSIETLKETAAACEEAALAIPSIVNSSGAGAGYGEGVKWFATTDGFFGETGGSSHSVSVAVVAKNDDGMERDYDYDSKTHSEDMTAAAVIGETAGKRAAARLSPRKIKSQRAPVIFDRRLSGSLISALAGAANGAAIARGVSYLKTKLGEQILPEGLTLIDDPHRPRGPGSRPFDGEGCTNAAFNFVENGVLKTWFLNSSTARQLGLETNARATRGVGGAPGAGSTNLYLPAGEKSPEDLRKDAGTGLLVTEMFGPQINSNTGDYSVGCSGYWFENGEILYPASEITIAGNMLEMFADITPANNLRFLGSVNAPDLLVSAMTIAGD